MVPTLPYVSHLSTRQHSNHEEQYNKDGRSLYTEPLYEFSFISNAAVTVSSTSISALHVFSLWALRTVLSSSPYLATVDLLNSSHISLQCADQGARVDDDARKRCGPNGEGPLEPHTASRLIERRHQFSMHCRLRRWDSNLQSIFTSR